MPRPTVANADGGLKDIDIEQAAAGASIIAFTVGDRLFRMKQKTFYQQVLKLGANEASAQGLQNAL